MQDRPEDNALRDGRPERSGLEGSRPPSADARRASVRRTALMMAAIAVAIYALFILSGVLAS